MKSLLPANASEKFVLDARSTDAAKAVFPLEGVCGGELVEICFNAQTNGECFDLGYVGLDSYRQGALLINGALLRAKKDVPDAFVGYYQIWGEKRRAYTYRFIVPFGADSAEIVFCAGAGAVLSCDGVRAHCVRADARERKNGAIKLVSHLGMTGYAPKNTLPAFSLTAACGYRECVTNTNHTKDGVLVALHDNTVDATSDGTGAIREMTYAQACAFDFGAYAHPLFKGACLPKLEDVLVLMKENGIRPVLRLGDFVGESEKYLKEMYALIVKTGHDGNFTAKAFSKEVLMSFSKIAKDAARYGLCTRSVADEDAVWLKSVGKDVYFDLRWREITQESVDTAFRHGIPCEAWIVNEFKEIIRLSKMGISGFTTDFFPMDGLLTDEI